MKVASGCCSECQAFLIVMKWREGRRIIVAECNCGAEMIFDILKMVEVLGEQQPENYVLMAEEPHRIM